MRLSIVLLWLSAALEVLGLASSAPFELLWLYSIYKFEYHVSGAGGARTVATGCAHNPSIPGQNPADGAKFVADALAAGLTGICSFDEFVKHIGKSASFSLYQYDSVGHQLNPDYVSLQTKFKKAVVQSHVYEFAPTKIFPGHDFGTIFPILYAPFIDLATDTFQLIRALAPNGAFVKSEVEKSQYWVRIANGYMAADNKVLGIPTDKEPKGHFLTNYSIVNFKTTMSGSKKYPVITTQDQKDQLRSLVENYSTSNDKAIIHQDVMDAFQHSSDALEQDITGCSLGKKRSVFKIRTAVQKSKF